MSLQPKPALSLAERLEGERAALEGRSELVDGKVFAMTSASLTHNAILFTACVDNADSSPPAAQKLNRSFATNSRHQLTGTLRRWH